MEVQKIINFTNVKIEYEHKFNQEKSHDVENINFLTFSLMYRIKAIHN